MAFRTLGTGPFFLRFFWCPQEEKQKLEQNQGMNMINSCHHLNIWSCQRLDMFIFSLLKMFLIEHVLDSSTQDDMISRSQHESRRISISTLAKMRRKSAKSEVFFLLVKKDVAPGDLVSVAFASGQHRDICGSRWVPAGQGYCFWERGMGACYFREI